MSQNKNKAQNKNKFSKTDAQKKPRPPKRITESYLHNAGLYYLQRFAASSAHFKKVMMRKINRSCAYHQDQDKEQCEALLDTLVEKFQNSGLLDDNSYARAMVHSLRRRGQSSRAVMAKMIVKGVQAHLIQTHLQQYDQESEGLSELYAALRLARKRRIGPFATNEEKENEDISPAATTGPRIIPRDKALAIMARAGFAYDMSQKVLSMTLDEALDIIDAY